MMVTHIRFGQMLCQAQNNDLIARCLVAIVDVLTKMKISNRLVNILFTIAAMIPC